MTEKPRESQPEMFPEMPKNSKGSLFLKRVREAFFETGEPEKKDKLRAEALEKREKDA